MIVGNWMRRQVGSGHEVVRGTTSLGGKWQPKESRMGRERSFSMKTASQRRMKLNCLAKPALCDAVSDCVRRYLNRTRKEAKKVRTKKFVGHRMRSLVMALILVVVAATTPVGAQEVDLAVSPELYGPTESWFAGADSGHGDGRWSYTYSSRDGEVYNSVVWRGPYLGLQLDSATSGRLIRKYPTVSISVWIPYESATRADNRATRSPGATVKYSVYCPSDPFGNPASLSERLGIATVDQGDWRNQGLWVHLGKWKVPSTCDRVFIYTDDGDYFSQHGSNSYNDRRIAIAHASIKMTYDLGLPESFTPDEWAEQGLADNWNCIVESYSAIKDAAVKTDKQAQDKGLWGNIIGIALGIFPPVGLGYSLAMTADSKFGQGNTHEALALAFWSLMHVCLKANPEPLTG